MIERIEVIRGPAAVRYGNGAAGGVVNIITKKIARRSGMVRGTATSNAPEHKDEGATKRTDFSLSPLGGDVSFRLYGNWRKPS